jgi:hypothetical protein
MTSWHGQVTMTPDSDPTERNSDEQHRDIRASHWLDHLCRHRPDDLSAMFRDEVLTVSGTGSVIVWDLTAWGWMLLLFGILQFAAGVALFGGAGWARWTAIVLTGVNAVANVGFITVNPLWTTLIVALDIVVIYQLAARWVPAEAYYPRYEGSDAAPTAARDQMTRIGAGL